MFSYDPRTAYMPYGVGFSPLQPTGVPHTFTNTYAHLATPEVYQVLGRLETQMAALNELVRAEFFRRTHAPENLGYNVAQTTGYAQGFNTGNQTAYGVLPFVRPGFGFMQQPVDLPLRLRESDSHLFCDIFLPHLSAGDVEVETIGTRIVCRTRVPVSPLNRWFSPATQLPRGLEVFELPDGRIECLWHCPVFFNPKEVEATFKDGFICICITKTEAATGRQTIKVARDNTTRRAANEMNS